VSGGKIVRTLADSRGFSVSAGKITTVVSHPTVQIWGAGSILSSSSRGTKSSGVFLSQCCDDIASTSKTLVLPSYSRVNFCLPMTYLRSTRKEPHETEVPRVVKMVSANLVLP